MTPEKIGKYSVVEMLGRGGMGEVYLGEDPYIGRRVAIKIIKGADPDARDRFLHEARVIGGLTHPSIVSLLDFDFSGDEPFLVMEYLKGEGLDAWIRNPRSLPEQLVVLDDLCQALLYAHQSGVLHRDVKPSNVQVLPNGRAKLMDFGIARGGGGKLTATGAVVGTPEYMAPEILNDAAYSIQSDLYACALLLYEMFTGSNPFVGKSIAATLTNVLNADPSHLHAVRPEVPSSLCDVVMACLSKEPERRPDTIAALIAAGEEARREVALRAGLPETRAIPRPLADAPAPSADASPIPKEGAGKSAFWVRFGVALLVVGLGGIFVLNRNSPAPPADGVPAADPLTTPVAPVGSPSPVPTPMETPLPGVASSPTPDRSVRPPRPEATRPPGATVAAAPSPLEAAPPARPTPTAAPSASPVAATPPTPTFSSPLPAPSGLPGPVVRPSVAASSEPAAPVPSLSTVSPRTVRRGSSVVLRIEGRDLRPDLVASVLQGRRPAGGIEVVHQEFVSPSLFRVTILIEPEVPLLTYTVVFRDLKGALTTGVQIEVVL